MRAERARLLTQEAAVIQRGVRWVERELEIASSDLHFIADLAAEAIGDGSVDRLTALERSALAFVRGRPGYFQIRFIDATGREAVKVEKATSGTESHDIDVRGARDGVGAGIVNLTDLRA